MSFKESDYIFTYNNFLFSDIFLDKFNLTWLENEEKKEFSIIPSESQQGIIDDKSIIYKYNTDMFRSDDFKIKHSGKHILFGGCSETEGVGGNIDETWSKILYDKISGIEQCSGFFNLARSGWGWLRIITNSLVYFNKYGYPDVYFILLPNNQRNFQYNMEKEKYSRWYYGQKYPEFYTKKLKENLNNINIKEFSSTPKEYLEDFLLFIISWKMFNKICIDNNIKLFFSTWDKMDSLNLENLNAFNNFITMNNDNRPLFIKKYYEDHKFGPRDVKKRDGHSGVIQHNFWADTFYNSYKENKK